MIYFDFKLKTFGNKDKSKIFYIIKRNKGSGFCSNFAFVLNHLKLADEHNFIPIIDMKNFKTIYNENSGSLKNKNSWNYYFKQVTNYSLEEVYKSRNVIISSDFFPKNVDFELSNNKDLMIIFKKYIKIKYNFIDEFKSFKKKKF